MWVYNVETGETSEMGRAGKPYTTLRAKEGSIIKMIVQGNTLRFMLDGKDLGVAFRPERLREKNIFLFVFLNAKTEKVRVLQGSTHD